MLLAHRVAGGAHVKQHTAILQQRRRRMVRQIFFDCSAGTQPGRGSATGLRRGGTFAAIAPYQPCRARRLVICAVWWRECQSYIASALTRFYTAMLGMVVALVELLFAERLQQRHPARMQHPQSIASEAPMGKPAVGQIGPGSLVVGLDGGPILGQRQLAARVRHGVAVGHVMHHLPHRPAAFAVGRFELRVGQVRSRPPAAARAAAPTCEYARRGCPARWLQAG